MTAVAKVFRFRVHDAGTTAPADATVDWSTTALLASVGAIGGQRVEALTASTSARPWSVTITDAEEFVTGKLASAEGRYHMLGRLADFSVSTDGEATWTVLQTGRVDNVAMEGVTAYRVDVTDERSVERSSTIFTGASTTRLAPSGLHAQWLHWSPGKTFRFRAAEVGASTTRYDAIGSASPDDHRGLGDNQGGPVNDGGLIIADAVLALMEGDRDVTSSQAGIFRTLRVNVDGTDREVTRINRGGAPDRLKALRDRGIIDSFTVADYADPVGVGSIRSCYFYAETHDPTPDIPLHIGGRDGIDPFQLAKDIYDGDWGDATVRYDADCFSAYHPTTNPRGLIGRFPKRWYRIEGPANMAAWLQEHVYTPSLVAPVLNSEGEIAPVFIGQPDAAEIPDVDLLPTFTAANSTIHPTWENRGRDQVTVARVTFLYAWLGGPTDEDRDVALDGLVRRELTRTFEHDNASTVRAVHDVTVHGVHRSFPEETARIGGEMCDRFGDGPVYATVTAHEGEMDDVAPGAWVAIDFDSYPAAQNQARGGTRIAQVLNRTILPAGIEFELLEAGPSLQALATPTVSVAANATDPHHAIDVTVSDLPTGAYAVLHIAESTLEPTEDSDAWRYRLVRQNASGVLLGNETVTVDRLPSGVTLWVRGRSQQIDRIASDWSTADSQATTGLTAPSSVTASDIDGAEALVTWTPGETDYDAVVDLTVLPDGAREFVARVVAGSTAFRLEGLAASTSYRVGVKHIDDYGGETTRDTDDFTSASTDDDVPDMQGIRILVGTEP